VSDAPRKSVRDAVAEQLQSEILDGTLKPGDRLAPERELAERLGVNRSSIREGLKKLEQLRLVRIQQGSGIHVRDPRKASFELVWGLLSREDQPDLGLVKDLLELREALVPGFLRLALSKATNEELESLGRALEVASDPKLDDEQYLQRLSDFGQGLAAATHNQVLVLLGNSVERFFGHPLARVIPNQVMLDRKGLVPHYRRLAIALAARDVETAEAATLELTRRVNKSMLGLVEQLLASPDSRADDTTED